MSNSEIYHSSNYNFDLLTQLETTIDLYQQSRESYWQARFEGEDWSPLKQLLMDADELARLIRERGEALRNIGSPADTSAIYKLYVQAEERLGIDWTTLQDRIREIFPKPQAEELISDLRVELADGSPEDPSPMRLVWERLCIDDAWTSVSSIPERAKRTLALETLVRDLLGRDAPPVPCRRYLSLVSRCFVFGFDSECIVMCRSAMEVALRDIVTEQHCRRAGRNRDDPTLDDLIFAAFSPANSLLAGMPDLYSAAQEVKERGNKAVHGDPDAVRDVFGTIRSALRIIDALVTQSRKAGI